jgi:hypothetical protein
MTRQGYPRQATFWETMGLLFGGCAVLALISAQLMFVAWML